MADLGDRLRDWFQLLHENAKQNSSGSTGTNPVNGMEIASGVLYVPSNRVLHRAVERLEMASVNPEVNSV